LTSGVDLPIGAPVPDVTSLLDEFADTGIDLGRLDAELDLSPEDARRRVIAEVVRREGQKKFRAALLDAYGACAITGETTPWVLQAAHIDPYMGLHSNTPDNGLLLRSDLHTLFDNFLIGVGPDNTVVVSTELGGTDYEALCGRILGAPGQRDQRPSAVRLARHHVQVLARGLILR
jgi:putative restriction endonuclease